MTPFQCFVLYATFLLALFAFLKVHGVAIGFGVAHRFRALRNALARWRRLGRRA